MKQTRTFIVIACKDDYKKVNFILFVVIYKNEGIGKTKKSLILD